MAGAYGPSSMCLLRRECAAAGAETSARNGVIDARARNLSGRMQDARRCSGATAETASRAALARLLMRATTGATLVARGNLAAVALKLALTRDAHAATPNVLRVVLVERDSIRRGRERTARVQDAAGAANPRRRGSADDDAQMRPGPAIAAACGERR